VVKTIWDPVRGVVLQPDRRRRFGHHRCRDPGLWVGRMATGLTTARRRWASSTPSTAKFFRLGDRLPKPVAPRFGRRGSFAAFGVRTWQEIADEYDRHVPTSSL